ncbi:dNA repair protein RecN [Anaerotruncus sp. CAG:390]|nr:dNA repair protein RecN [Anaerotruncus sp. CAG:390]
MEEILEFRADAEKKLADLESGDDRLAELRRRESALDAELRESGAALGEVRSAAAASLEGRVAESLAFLDMPKVRFAISVTPLDEPSPRGLDRVEFMIATNPGEPQRPLAKIASGGELSRIMLSLKSVMSDIDGIPTLIYDEVDAGISGKTSRKVGIKLKEAARGAQIFCVTHSAQIASLADTHLLISKTERDGRSESTVTRLDEAGRVEETARILGGINVTDAQRIAARELIAEGRAL